MPARENTGGEFFNLPRFTDKHSILLSFVLAATSEPGMRFGAYEVNLRAPNGETFPEVEDPETHARYVVALPGRTFTIGVLATGGKSGGSSEVTYHFTAWVDGVKIGCYYTCRGVQLVAIQGFPRSFDYASGSMLADLFRNFSSPCRRWSFTFLFASFSHLIRSSV
jgi:hypothetical protein